MRHTLQSVSNNLRFSFTSLAAFVGGAALAACDVANQKSDMIVGVQASAVGECLYEPPGVFRPECRSEWSNSDATWAIHASIALAKQHIDATNCDIRTTSQRSPYNSNEPWCGGVAFQSGITYPMPSSIFGTSGGTWMTSLDDYHDPDPVFGITLEADDRFGARPILALPLRSAFGIGPHDRLRHLHIKGYYASNPPVPACGASETACRNDGALTEVGVYANGSETEYNDGWRIDDSRVEGFSNYGIQAHYSRDARIVNSTINGNGNGGIYGLGSLRLYVADNQVYQNGANGIDMGDSNGSSIIERNTVYRNGWRGWDEQIGILLGNTSNNVVRGNTVYHYPPGSCARLCFGIMVDQGNNNQVLDNTVFGHTEAGIQVGWRHPTQECSDSAVTSNVQISGNSVNNNFANGSQIEVECDVSGNITVSNNVITRPGECMTFRADVTYFNNACNSVAPAPTVSSIVLNPAQPRQYQPYSLTINGSGFDPANLAEVILKTLPPGCTFGSCESYLGEGYISLRTPTQLVLNHMVNGIAGTYEISVRNGRFNTRSNAVSFTVAPYY